MAIKENQIFTLESLAKKLDKHIDDIEEFLINGDITPSIRRIDGLELYEINIEFNDNTDEWEAIPKYSDPEPAEAGIYDIINYGNIRWDYNGSLNQKTARLTDIFVYLSKDHRNYSIAFGYLLKKDDLIVTNGNLETFLARDESAVEIEYKDNTETNMTADNGFIKKWNLPNRANGDTISPRKVAPITMILNHAFEECMHTNPEIIGPNNKVAFYNYLKKEVAKDTKLKNGESFAFYIEEVHLKGANSILMKHKIEGRKSDSKQERWYTDASIGEKLSRIRKNMKNRK